VLKRDRAHAAAIPLYIHAVEASPDPKRAERYADTLAQLAPRAGHLVHMPSHIYFVICRYKDSLATNLAAVNADEAYIAARDPSGVYPLDYYPHNCTSRWCPHRWEAMARSSSNPRGSSGH
jgi:hypothetical protein